MGLLIIFAQNTTINSKSCNIYKSDVYNSDGDSDDTKYNKKNHAVVYDIYS